MFIFVYISCYVNLIGCWPIQLFSYFFNWQQQRERVKKIEEGIRFAKQQYSEVLGNLENISEEIHRRRRNKAVSMSFTKDGEPNEDFRKSMNDASLNEVDQKKLIEYMTRSSDHLNTDENDNK